MLSGTKRTSNFQKNESNGFLHGKLQNHKHVDNAAMFLDIH